MNKAEAPDTTCVSSKLIRELLGMSTTQFYRHVQYGNFKKIKKGRYNAAQCVQAYIEYLNNGKATGDIAEERKQLVVAQRQKIQLEMEEKRRELVPLVDVHQCFNEAMVIVSSQLDGLPGRQAGELAGIDDPAVIRKTLFEETRRIRDATADKLETFAGGYARRGDSKTSSTANS